MQPKASNPLLSAKKGPKIEVFDDAPVVKMFKPANAANLSMTSGGGSIMNSMRRSSAPKRSSQPPEQHRQELERHRLREGDFRRLLSEPEWALRYDQRLDRAERLVKQVKYSVYEADKTQAAFT